MRAPSSLPVSRHGGHVFVRRLRRTDPSRKRLAAGGPVVEDRLVNNEIDDATGGESERDEPKNIG
jgi:hypothetical protein